MAAMERQTVFSGSPYEGIMGYSRAVRIGDHVFIAGTAPIMADGGDPPADAYGQTKRCLEIIAQAIGKAGLGLDSVIRTRVMLTDISRWEEAARAHGEVFGEIRPASTFVEVKGLIDRGWLVEIEADCVAADRAG